MRLISVPRLLVCVMLLVAVLVGGSRAEGPHSQKPDVGDSEAAKPRNVKAEKEAWPEQVAVTVGDVRTRIDGPKLWTLSGIDFQDTVMATEDSAYGSVLTIRGVGHLGTAHFLDVPGKPGEVEKEQVTSLQFFVDGKRVGEFAPSMNLKGKSFRMERKSAIRAMNLESSISIRDDVLMETVHFHATGPMDLQSAYPWMYAFSPKATVYVFGDKDGILGRGTFLSEGKTASQVIKDANWVAVFDPSSGKGSVCCFLKHPPTAEGSFLLIDAPGIYRKVAAYSLVDKVVPEGFAGTYQSAVGFFNGTEQDWEALALRRAREMQVLRTER